MLGVCTLFGDLRPSEVLVPVFAYFDVVLSVEGMKCCVFGEAVSFVVALYPGVGADLVEVGFAARHGSGA
jgi:hypothetical protein